MSGLPGNPHADAAFKTLELCDNYNGEAIAEAILALAYEQRNAALVALYAASISVGGRDKATQDVLRQIIERMALDVQS